jgi:hypothetical protein
MINGNGGSLARPRRKYQPRTVDLLDGDDFECVLLGSLGFSTRLIQSRTGLTPSQVGYRLRRAGVKRADYRNGESPLADSVFRTSRRIATPTVQAHVREVLGWAQE